MKQLLLTPCLFFAFSCFSQSPGKSKPEGKWTESFGFDSIPVFKPQKGFRTYFVNQEGDYTMLDSMNCNNHDVSITGHWYLSENNLIVQHYNSECVNHWPDNEYIITWINDDLFYSVHVFKAEAPVLKQYTVFRRIH